MATLRSAIAKTIAPVSTLASLTQIFLTSSFGTDLDPEVQIFVRGVKMLRRMIYKHAEVKAKVKKIIHLYRNGGLKGCEEYGPQIGELQPCPAVGMKGRKMG